MDKTILWIFLILMAVWGGGVQADEAKWRNEFERICAMTGRAGGIGPAELDELIADSDILRDEIAAEAGGEGKVYLFRLKKCREFFVFMKDSRSSGEAGESTP